MPSVLGAGELGVYTPHALHHDDCTWPETNCYVDVWILVLNSLGLDPVPALAFTLGTDYEGDQYTFFKYPHPDLWSLYGVEVQELNVWKGVAAHAVEQVALGRFLMPEMDSFYLPDTAGVAYQLEHVKSTIAIGHIDMERRLLRYLHNRGYYTLSGDDFDAVLRLGAHAPAPGVLPPYTEIAKLDRIVRRSSSELAERAVALARTHLTQRPTRNPIAKHRERFAGDLKWLIGEPLSSFHLYAFATVRQAGAAFSLTAAFLRWFEAHGEKGLEPAAAAFDRVSTTAKTVQFKLARMANLRREVDVTPLLETMEKSWDEGMSRLVDYYGD